MSEATNNSDAGAGAGADTEGEEDTATTLPLVDASKYSITNCVTKAE